MNEFCFGWRALFRVTGRMAFIFFVFFSSLTVGTFTLLFTDSVPKNLILVAFVKLSCRSQCCESRMCIPNSNIFHPGSRISCPVPTNKGREIGCPMLCHFCRFADPHHLDADPDPRQRLFETATTSVQTIQGSSFSLHDYFLCPW
jgi:hypothetical protein